MVYMYMLPRPQECAGGATWQLIPHAARAEASNPANIAPARNNSQLQWARTRGKTRTYVHITWEEQLRKVMVGVGGRLPVMLGAYLRKIANKCTNTTWLKRFWFHV